MKAMVTLLVVLLAAVSAFARPWPPTDLKIERHEDCGITYIEFTGRDGNKVKIITPEKQIQIDVGPKKKDPGVIEPGTPADITISAGWLYLIGKQASVGAGTIVGAAESSKLIVDARVAATPRILYPGTGGKGKVWIKGYGANAKELPAGTKSEPAGAQNVKDPANLDAGDKTFTDDIAKALKTCRDNGHDFGMEDP